MQPVQENSLPVMSIEQMKGLLYLSLRGNLHVETESSAEPQETAATGDKSHRIDIVA